MQDLNFQNCSSQEPAKNIAIRAAFGLAASVIPMLIGFVRSRRSARAGRKSKARASATKRKIE